VRYLRRNSQLEFALVKGFGDGESISRCQGFYHRGRLEPNMNVIAEESLIDEKVLVANRKHLLHANLRNTINKELFIMVVTVLEEVLLATYLV
jgi:hypothetical protein